MSDIAEPDSLADATTDVAQAARTENAAYAPGAQRPLGSYLSLIGLYGAGVATLSGVVALRRRPLPDRVGAGDLALIAVATHKISRLIAKDPVTSPLRAPFTTYKGTGEPAQMTESARGTGPRHAVGELLTCPFCVGQWVATGLVFGLLLAPRATRLTAAMFSALAGSDFLQYAYSAVQQKVEG